MIEKGYAVRIKFDGFPQREISNVERFDMSDACHEDFMAVYTASDMYLFNKKYVVSVDYIERRVAKNG